MNATAAVRFSRTTRSRRPSSAQRISSTSAAARIGAANAADIDAASNAPTPALVVIGEVVTVREALGALRQVAV